MNTGGINFNGDGMIMSGWWYNPTTGDSFEVRDCYFDNSDYKVQTMDGRILSYSQIERYVQSDKPIKKQPKINPAVTENKGLGAQALKNAGASDAIVKDTKTEEPLPSAVLNELYGETTTVSNATIEKQPEPKKSVNYEMIDRAIGEKMEKCEMETKCKWGVVSEDEIKVLVNMMKIDVQEIAEYIYEKKCSKEQIIEQLVENLNYILS